MFQKVSENLRNVSERCGNVSDMFQTCFRQLQKCLVNVSISFENVSDLLRDIFKLCEQFQKCFGPVCAAVGAYSLHAADSRCVTVQNVQDLPKCFVNVSDSFSM
jgi:hypothetical protein